jgi:dTDP-4-dehydrorhamnose reductase
MKKLLLTGASGFLGWNLCQQLSDDFQVTGIYYRQHFNCAKLKWYRLNLLEIDKIKKCIDEINPDIVLHAAAIANTNFCEENPALSHHVNVYATIELAKICREKNIPFLFISTDLVFNGNSAPYSEWDMTHPLSVYGNQKLLAEDFLINELEKVLICRLPLLFGYGAEYSKNFMTDWIQMLKKGEKLNAFYDEIRSALAVNWAATGIKKALNYLLEEHPDKKVRLFHLGGSEPVSRYNLAIKIADTFDLNKDLVSSVSRFSVPMSAPRPENVTLDSLLAKNTLGFIPPALDDQLDTLKKKRL